MPKISVAAQTTGRRLSWTLIWTPSPRHWTCTDDLLKAAPDRVPSRAPVGIAPRISHAELITLAVLRPLLRPLIKGKPGLREIN